MGETAGEIRHDIEQTRARMSATIEAIGYRMDIPARMRYRFSHIVHDVGSAFTGKPDGDGGEPGLLQMSEEKVGSMMQAAQSGIAQAASAVEGRVAEVGQTVQSGISDIKENVMERMTTTGDSAMTSAQETTQQVRETAMGTWRRMGGFAKENALALSVGALALGVLAGMFIPRSRVEQERIAPLAGDLKHKAVETGEKVIHKGQQMAEETLSGQGGSGSERRTQPQTGEPMPAGTGRSGYGYGME